MIDYPNADIMTKEIVYFGVLINENCKEELHQAVEHLSDYQWSHPGCAKAWSVVKDAYGKKISVDHTLLLAHADDALTSSDIADMITTDLVKKMENFSPICPNAPYYRELLLKHQNKKIAEEATKRMYQKITQGEDVGEEMNTIAMASVPKKQTLFTYGEVVDQSLEEIENVLSGESPPTIKTQWNNVDAIVGGFQPKDLVILAARPSMGKTAFGLNILNHAVINKKKCLFFSMEMDSVRIMHRLISTNTNINTRNLASGNLTDNDLDKLANFRRRVAQGQEFFISDAMGTIDVIKAQANQACARMLGLDLLVVDYLQLIKTSGDAQNREREVAQISSSLKQIARDTGCCVIALSQLSRNVDSRNPPIPNMSDLRDSGSIEQDADVIILLYREGYYKQADTSGKTEIIIAKNRNGEVGTTSLFFKPQFMRFEK
jgi:replicative DNA helicase